MWLLEYAWMLNDSVRIEAFKKAIEGVVSPGDVVVEIGAGLGTFGFFASQAGAERVYSIEDSAYEALESIANRQEFQEKIRVVRGNSLDVSLPEKADLIIFEDFGSAFLGGNLRAVIQDATLRFLKPGGRWIPEVGVLCGALMEAPQVWSDLASWRKRRDYLNGLDFQKLSEWLLNGQVRGHYGKDVLITVPRDLKRFRFQDPNENFQLNWSGGETALRDGEIHGLCLWFRLELGQRIVLNNGPGEDDTVYQQEFFPLSTPLPVGQGAPIHWSLQCMAGGKKGELWWKWLVESENAVAEGTTFAGLPLSMENLERRSAEHIPRLGPHNQIAQIVFEMVDGKRSQGEIATAVRARFPQKFSSEKDALRFVVNLLGE